MNRGVRVLLGAQFLTAFADNAILFTAIAMLFFDHDAPPRAAWYVPALQASFLVAFVALAPWSGPFADRRPKPHVLLIGNLLKAAGAALMFAGVEPLAAYALVGAGAAVYSPAKYGILPELVGSDRLVRANGWIEGSTILAIVLGTVVGSRIADRSTSYALMMVIVCYAASAAAALALPRLPASQVDAAAGIGVFVGRFRTLFETATWRFSMLGNALFWASAAVLRLLLVAWAPVVLLTATASDVADLTLFLALGIVVGALLVPHLIPSSGCAERASPLMQWAWRSSCSVSPAALGPRAPRSSRSASAAACSSCRSTRRFRTSATARSAAAAPSRCRASSRMLRC